jgi:MFS family permease
MLGQAANLSGNWMQTVGQGWLVYRLTGSPVALGAFSFASLLPVVPISIFGSALIDRFPKRRLVLVTQFALLINALAWALLASSNHIQMWQILALSFFEGAVGSIDLPARQALLPELVGREDLSNSIALNQMLFQASRIVGPALAGVVIAGYSESMCFLLNAASFVPFILGLVSMRSLYRDAGSDVKVRKGSGIQGLRYLLANSNLAWLLVLMAVSSFLLLPYVTLLPVFAKDVLKAGPQGLGLLTTSVGIGATIGSLWLAGMDGSKRRLWLVVSLYLLPLSVVLFTTAHSLAFAMVIALFIGLNTTWMQTIFNTLVQLYVRDDMRGRTMSTYIALSVGTQRVGGLGAGFVGEFVGIPTALRLATLVSLAVTTGVLLRRPTFMQPPPTISTPPRVEVTK